MAPQHRLFFWFSLLELEEQEAPKRFIVIKDKIRVENGESWAQVSPHNGFKVSLEIDFEHKKIKESGQKLTIDFSEQSYLKGDIAS